MTKSSASAAGSYKKLAPLVAGLSVLFIYAAYPTVNYYWDGIIYSQFVEDASAFDARLLHPNHLFYNALGYAMYHAAQSIGWQTRALFTFQSATIVFGALCAIVFFLIVQRAFRSSYLSVALTAIFSFSAAWWRFATDADVYVISVFFLLAAFYLILPERLPRPLIVAFAHASAMFFHELAILFFPAVVLGLYFQTATFEKKKRIYIVAQYCAAVALLTAAVYCLAYYAQVGELNFKSFAAWLTSYAASESSPPSVVERLQLTMRGHRQLFIDGGANLFQRDFLNYVLFGAFAFAATVFLWRCVRHWRDAKIFFSDAAWRKIFRQPLAWLCAAWAIPYLIFLFFFMPENLFYRLFYFPALILFLGVAFSAFETIVQKRRGRLALFAALFALYNFLFYIQPNAIVRPDTQIAAALQAKAVWSDKTVVFYESIATDDLHRTNNRLFKYFNPSVAWQPLDSITLKEFENKILTITADGGNVWIDSAAAKRMSANPQTTGWLAENLANSDLAVPRYEIKYARIAPKTFGRDDLAFSTEREIR